MLTIHRQRFSLNCKAAFAAQGEWLADAVQSRYPIVEGGTIQIGWSVLRFLNIDGGLFLCEPNFSRNPFIEFQPDVSTTLEILLSQNNFLSKLQCQGLPSRFDEKVVVQKGALSQERIIAQRQAPTQGDSGWFISPIENCNSNNVSELEAIWLYQLLTLRPKLLCAMSLPENWLVAWNGNEIEAVINGENQNVWQPHT